MNLKTVDSSAGLARSEPVREALSESRLAPSVLPSTMFRADVKTLNTASTTTMMLVIHVVMKNSFSTAAVDLIPKRVRKIKRRLMTTEVTRRLREKRRKVNMMKVKSLSSTITLKKV